MICFKVINLVICWFMYLPSTRFSPTCRPFIDHPEGMLIFTVVEVVIQGIPVYLTLSRCAQIESATHAKKIISLTINLRRQGMLCWSSITLFSSLVIVFMAQARDVPSLFPHISYPLFVTLLSAVNCRLLLQKQEPSSGTTDDNNFSVPSFVLDSYDSPWDASCSNISANNSFPPIDPQRTLQDH
ncbi:hypothetical protein NP233_g6901 [Leucocoprinus birnbaumii]|uniref:Uncharacterized protein n=1 Tax=Leucocoprinus birnbaumii TaxID=56174 RepID=A0AAD5VQ67_9AGAR|nr:hypothetical protein NP233_g6901 [Leucocoprinus birnbaumii]